MENRPGALAEMGEAAKIHRAFRHSGRLRSTGLFCLKRCLPAYLYFHCWKKKSHDTSIRIVGIKQEK
ncbi:MAG: hypothetical protein ACREEM_25215, partial [Blastocatellia bacterium]